MRSANPLLVSIRFQLSGFGDVAEFDPNCLDKIVDRQNRLRCVSHNRPGFSLPVCNKRAVNSQFSNHAFVVQGKGTSCM